MRPCSLLEGCNKVRCKWVFKTKHDSYDTIERYKAGVVTKGFFKKMLLIIRKHFCLFLRNILSKLS